MTSPLHFPGMTFVQGPYIINYTDLPNDGDTKTLWTPSIGDVILGIFGDCNTSIQGEAGGVGFSNAGLNFGTVATPTFFSPLGPYDFIGFLYRPESGIFPRVIASASPIILTYYAAGEGVLTAGHVELYAVISRSPTT